MTRTDSEQSNDFTSETYRAIFRFARDAIILEREDQSIVDANPAAEVMFGYPLDELLQMRTVDLKALAVRDEIPHRIYSDPDTDENLTFQTEVISKDGFTFPVEISITRFQSEKGRLFLSIIHNISIFKDAEKVLRDAQVSLESQVAERTIELTKANEEIQARERRFRNLVQSSLQGIMIVEGPPYRIAFSNPAVSGILGHSIEAIENFSSEDFESLIHWIDRNRVLNAIEDIRSGTKESERMEARFNKKPNEVVWLDLSMTGVDSEGKSALLMTLIDVTEQRQAIADLKDSQKDLELYASLLRHDLRNDLQVITGNSEVMRISAPDNEMVQEFAEANFAGVKRMLDVLNIFGKADTQRKRYIAPILEGVSVDAAQSYVGMKCTLHIDPDVLMVRVVGGRMLLMVFHNLIGNSAKYAGSEPRVDISASKSDNFIAIRFADNGPGIPESIKPNLFEKGVSTTGSGLGLYLSQKIVEAYGGTIELLEPQGEYGGATFLIRLAIVSG